VPIHDGSDCSFIGGPTNRDGSGAFGHGWPDVGSFAQKSTENQILSK